MEQLTLAMDTLRVSEIELVYRPKIKPSARPKVSDSAGAAKVLRTIWNEDTLQLREEFKILLLNRGGKVLGVATISIGSIDCTAVDIRLIFATALKANATSIILAHNHPSDSLKPSSADQTLTDQVKAAGEILNIKVKDHIILTQESYYSFADEGVL